MIRKGEAMASYEEKQAELCLAMLYLREHDFIGMFLKSAKKAGCLEPRARRKLYSSPGEIAAIIVRDHVFDEQHSEEAVLKIWKNGDWTLTVHSGIEFAVEFGYYRKKLWDDSRSPSLAEKYKGKIEEILHGYAHRHDFVFPTTQ